MSDAGACCCRCTGEFLVSVTSSGERGVPISNVWLRRAWPPRGEGKLELKGVRGRLTASALGKLGMTSGDL
jgi:hypothetical protein